jgi:tetratricopeptide (TPR) repeat protein/SAM-dependent methyltransferase
MPPPDPFLPLLERAAAHMQAGRPDAAETLYRQVLAQAPEHVMALHFLGMALVQTGRAAEGLPLMARSMGALQGQARFRYNFAAMLAHAGDLAGAERELEAAAAAEPRNPGVLEFLGVVRRQRGRVREAVDALRAAAAAAPRSAQIANNLGTALGDAGDLGGAVECFRRAAALEPRHALAWFNLAVNLHALGDAAGALDALQNAVHADPRFTIAWQHLAQLFAGRRYAEWQPDVARLLAEILAHPEVDVQPLAEAAATLLVRDPALSPAIDAFARGEGRAWLAANGAASLARPMLLQLVEAALLPDATLESFLRALREALLLAWRDATLHGDDATTLAAALAQQCFLNEYVWPTSAAEEAALERVVQAGRTGTDPLACMLLGCYRALAAVAELPKPSPLPEPCARAWRRQVEEPLEEGRLLAGIPALTAIDDDISQAVRRQYEENPYPRWHRLAATLAMPHPVRQAVQALFPHVEAAHLALPDVPDILVAGCGTGFQAAVTAARNPHARVLAVDLSLPSLAFAQRRCRELGLANVEFAQADLLRLADLGRRFHYIECAGVLHHLRDPMAGWRVLRDILVPGGVMKIALYSEAARRGVVAARDLAARHGLGSDLASVREIRRLVLAAPAGSDVRELAYSADFCSASGVRDLLLHVQEHRFTLAKIAAALDRLSLRFLGFELDDPAVLSAYRERFADDPHAVSLANWQCFEADRPATFAGMYQFWTCASRDTST